MISRLWSSKSTRQHALALLVAVAALALGGSRWSLELEGQWGLKALCLVRNLIDGVRTPDDLVIVSIDRQSFFDSRHPELMACLQQRRGQMQRCWSRSLYGELVKTLRQFGAELVILNVLFADRRPDEDPEFAAAIREAGNVVLQDILYRSPAGTSSEFIAALPPVEPLDRAALATAPFPVQDTRSDLLQFWTTIPSVTVGEVANVAQLRATLPFLALHLLALRHALDPLGLELSRVAPAVAGFLGQGGLTARERVEGLIARLLALFQRQPDLADQVLADLDMAGYDPVSARYLKALVSAYRWTDRSLYLNPYGPRGSFMTIPFQDVARTPDAFRNKIVVVAPSAELGRPVKGGSFPTVLGEVGSGELLATAYANLLESRFAQPLEPGWAALLAASWAYLLTLSALRLASGLGVAVPALMVAGYGTVSIAAFRSASIWLPLVQPLFLATLALLLRFGCRYLEQRRRIEELIAIKIPHGLMPLVQRSDSPLSGRFVSHTGVCLVTDGEGYTALADSRAGDWLAHFMKDYQAVVEKPVREQGGTVKDWAGDGMMALWWEAGAGAGECASMGLLQRLRHRFGRSAAAGTARQEADVRMAALDAAILIQAEVARFTRDHDIRFPIRIGLNFGPMWISLPGELKAFGDTLNTTQRLEGLNKVLGTRILLAETVIQGLAGYFVRDLGIFVLPGKRQPVRVYELLGHSAAAAGDAGALVRGFAEALDRFEKADWHGAFELFALLREDFPDDGPTRFYIKACRERLRPK